jgi:capsule polysaccharide export protein KpsE/RkpR
MADIINLRTARKRKARDAKDAQAAENRIKFGRTKAEKELEEAKAALESKRIDAHKRDD